MPPLGEQSPQEAIDWKFKATYMQKNFHGMLKQVEYKNTGLVNE